MNDEIKEILKDLKKYANDGGEHKLMEYEIKHIQCCITNLQQEIQKKEAMYDSLAVDYRLAQEENERLKEELENKCWDEASVRADILLEQDDYKSRVEKASEYITSYEAISTIQGLDRTEQNKTLDERTMNVMVERYLQVHQNLLNILQNGSDEE